MILAMVLSDLLPPALLLAEPPDHVFDVDDRIVDDVAQRDHEAGQDHHVDRGAVVVQHQAGGHDRQRHRRAANQGDAPFVQEEEQHADQEHAPDDQRHGEPLDRRLDVRRRAKDGGVDVDVGQAGPQRVDGRLNALGDLQAVRPGELLDDQQQAGAVVDDAVADHGLMADHHVGHVLELNGFAVLDCDDDFRELVRVDLVGFVNDRQHVPNAEALIGSFDPTAGADVVAFRAGIQAHRRACR